MKVIIDRHIQDRYDYYRNICYYHFQGRYLWEDLFQETYLKLLEIKPETIEFYDSIDKLHCIVIRTIKSLRQESKRAKKNKQGHTSPLFEINGLDISHGYFDESDSINEIEIQEQFEKANKAIEKALSQPVAESKEVSDYLKIKTFVHINETNTYRVSKKTGISRQYLNQIYQQGRELLLNEITK